MDAGAFDGGFGFDDAMDGSDGHGCSPVSGWVVVYIVGAANNDFEMTNDQGPMTKE
jgi:hypothetical protein